MIIEPYSTGQIVEASKKVIEKYNLIFVEDLCAYLGISKDTFYKYTKELSPNDFDAIKILLKMNMVKTKVGLRFKWEISDSAPLQLALYKLCATDEEIKKLSMTPIDLTTKGEKITNNIDLNKLSEDELTSLLELRRKADTSSSSEKEV